MAFLDSAACKRRLACGPCRSNPEWRAAFGAPEICPFAPSIAPDPTTTPSLVQKRAICAACEHFQTPACCGCPEARKDPARELSACRFSKWSLAPETSAATPRETTGPSHALGNRQLENPG